MTKKATIFKFDGYKIDAQNSKIVFKYSIEFQGDETLNFSETVILPKKTARLNHKDISKFLEPLSLILGISYYKLYCPPKIETFCKLSKEQAQFWNTVYRKGLGEFLYRNKLDPKNIAKFPYTNHKVEPARVKTNDAVLLGIGGGKDSIVALELLKKYSPSLFLLETTRPDPVAQNIMKQSGKTSFTLKRILDPKIFEKHPDSYNGHIPISAGYALSGLLLAALYGYRYVVVGNAHTSDFGNIKYKGEMINHQWSKSSEFEALLQDYTRKFISQDITYFSLLRQFYEIRVAKLFSQHKKYFSMFCSCNKSLRIYKDRPENRWCGECPKCAFVFLILAPFIEKKELVKIFGKNLLNESSLLSLYKDLLGFGKMKPFDCVGTFDESRVSLFLAAQNNFKDDLVVKALLHEVEKQNPEKMIKEVFETVSAPTLPTQFKLLGIENVCILGYGKEGKITEKYLKKNYPDVKIKILDQALDKNYLEKQKDCDFAIKTPGIPKNKVTIPYTTATNLFFSENRNLTIGVTGSKGKSTTASLIYQILKKAGKKVRLLGNIGNPMLKALLTTPKQDEIFVIELSSYMLEDIEYSPNIAVLLNLFPEHMNYHGGVENYYQAKQNIFRFQKVGDVALKFPFKTKIPVPVEKIKLLGNHNLENIKAAVAVAKILKIPEKAIQKAILEFKNLPHRLDFVGEFKGIKFYDDAISTTPESTIMAIQALPRIGTIFLGGEDRGYNFKNLEKMIKKHKIENMVLFPDSGKKILKSRKGLNVLETRNMSDAVRFAFKNTPKGTICLLSTAAPSYSVWKNFEEKGDLFKTLVKKYGKN